MQTFLYPKATEPQAVPQERRQVCRTVYKDRCRMSHLKEQQLSKTERFDVAPFLAPDLVLQQGLKESAGLQPRRRRSVPVHD